MMASKRRLRREVERQTKAVMCRGKIKHDTETTAYQHAKSLHDKDGAAMNWFRCKSCGTYHVGHV